MQKAYFAQFNGTAFLDPISTPKAKMSLYFARLAFDYKPLQEAQQKLGGPVQVCFCNGSALHYIRGSYFYPKKQQKFVNFFARFAREY